MSSRAITFDFHNTLIHCDPWFELEVRTLPGAFLRRFGQERGAPPNDRSADAADAAYRRLRRSIIAHGHELTAERSLAMVFNAQNIEFDEAAITNGVRVLMSEALNHAQPVPGAIETVQCLSERGVVLGVVSSAVYHPFLEWSLHRFGLGDRFSVIVTSASCGYYKSRPEIYWSALSSLEADPGGSLHVGDSARFDVDGAHRAGLRTAWLNSNCSAEPPSSEPDLVLSSLEGSALALHQLLTKPVP